MSYKLQSLRYLLTNKNINTGTLIDDAVDVYGCRYLQFSTFFFWLQIIYDAVYSEHGAASLAICRVRSLTNPVLFEPIIT